MSEVVIDGVKYRLVPVKDEKKDNSEVLDDYLGTENRLESVTKPQEKVVPKAKSLEGVIKRAVGEKYGYRERYKTKTLKPSDLMTYSRPRKVTKQFDPESMDPNASKQAGYNVWFGPGTEIDF